MPKVANHLAGQPLLTPEQADATAVRTQMTCQLGRPDIEVRTSDACMLVEVKVGMGFGLLAGAPSPILAGHRLPQDRAVLLTRYGLESDGEVGVPDALAYCRAPRGRLAFGHAPQVTTLKRQDSRLLC